VRRPPRRRKDGGEETPVLEIRPLVVRSVFELIVCVLTLGLGWVSLWVARLGRRYSITTQRIETRQGVFSVRRDFLEIFRIEDLEVDEPFFLRMRGAGHLRIWSMDESGPQLVLEAIPDVQNVYETVRKLTRDERGRNQVRVVELG
jgi:membrane protein YdbS with pleckstrin-like domain